LCGFFFFAVSCRQKSGESVRPDLVESCVVVETGSADAPSAWNEWINRHMTAVKSFSIGQIQQASETCLASDLVLVVTGSKNLDDEFRRVVIDHLARGGRLLNLGLDHVLEGHPGAGMAGIDIDHYISTSRVFRIHPSGRDIQLKPHVYKGSYQPIDGIHTSSSRWISVMSAVPVTAENGGWPAFVYLSSLNPDLYPVSGWFSLEPAREDSDNLIPAVGAMIEAMTREVYLRKFRIDRYSSTHPVPVSISAEWIDRRSKDLSPLRMAVSWINERGVEIRRVVSPPLDPLVMPISLNIGQTPETSLRSERYTLRISLRDRNDQITYDTSDHTLKLFPETSPHAAGDSIGVNSGQLTLGRRPVFMLGVNYWPRLAGALATHGKHWLDYVHFDPAQLTTDLDLMVSVGINCIAIEYTNIEQAPQLLYVLDELRSRSMWVNLYIPALYPLDLRMEEAERMLEAIDLKSWPEVFALETARGLAVKPKPEMRRLDAAWAEWIDEHFNTIREAEQMLGVTLWKERGRITGPPDMQLSRGPHRNPAVALYYTFLHDYASRRMGYVRHWLREEGYTTLLTARTAYGAPGDPHADAIDYLDVSAGSLHLDFLSPDAWTIHPLRSIYSDGELLHAYIRGIGEGKPIVWSAYGQHVGSIPSSLSYQRQMEVYKYFLDQFIQQGSSGAFASWFAPGKTTVLNEDWGLVYPQSGWRLVEESFRAAKLRLRQGRIQPRATIRKNAPLNLSSKQWRDQQADRSGLFAKAVSSDTSEWTLPGTGLNSDILLNPSPEQRWSEVEGFHLLNAEWRTIDTGNTAINRAPGENVKIYTGKSLTLELMNSGSIRWVNSSEKQPGSIWLRISQPGHPDEWNALMQLVRGGKQSISWTPRESGIWELQPYMIGYGKFGERLKVEVTEPPRLF